MSTNNGNLKGFESDWYINSRKTWVKVWESLDQDVAISKVPVPMLGEDGALVNPHFSKILLTLGLNLRAYEKPMG